MKSKIIHWPNQNGNTTAIAPLQAIVAGQPLRLNTNSGNSYLFKDMIRNFVVYGAADISDVSFLIKGIGTPIAYLPLPGSTTNLNYSPLWCVGPIVEGLQLSGAGNSATSAYIYTRIDSITPNKVPLSGTGVSVGFGPGGVTAFTYLNLNNLGPQNFGIQGMSVNAANTFTVTVQGSLLNPDMITNQGQVLQRTDPIFVNNNLPTPPPVLPRNPNGFFPIPFFTVGTPYVGTATNFHAAVNGSPTTFICCQVNDVADGNADFFQIFVQQGIST